MGRGRERGSREGMTAREIGAEREGKTGQREEGAERQRHRCARRGTCFRPAPDVYKAACRFPSWPCIDSCPSRALSRAPIRASPASIPPARRFPLRPAPRTPSHTSSRFSPRRTRRCASRPASPRTPPRAAARSAAYLAPIHTPPHASPARVAAHPSPRPLRSPDLPPAPPLIHGSAPFHCTSELSLENIMLELIEKVTTRRGAHLWLG